MAPKITAPDSFTGIRSGIEFTDGTAEVDSLDDASRAVFADHGFTVEGENGPTEAEIEAQRLAEEAAEAEKAEAERKAAEEQAEREKAETEEREAAEKQAAADKAAAEKKSAAKK